MMNQKFQPNRPKSPIFVPSQPKDESDKPVESNKTEMPSGVSPIETAPLDGRTIVLYSATISHGIRAKWRTSRKCVNSRWVINNFWADPTTNKPLGATFTHWKKS